MASSSNGKNGLGINSMNLKQYLRNALFVSSFAMLAACGGSDGNTTTVTTDSNSSADNNAPISTSITATTTEDTAVTITLAGTDVDGDNLTYSIDQPDSGTATVFGDEVIYTPETGFSGSASFTYTANDGTSESAVATVSITIIETVTGKLNDTGITQCSDADINGLSCPITDHPDQDAQYGRDVTNNDDSDGHAGFSFTKIDDNGDELLANATEWSCVKDNVTGLIWEVKQGGNGTVGDEGLHDADDRYNWYTTDTSNDGGFEGYQDDDGAICHGYSADSATSYCNTEAFAERVNSQGLCGESDWRLPTREELRSIVSYDRIGPTIDTEYFPNTISSGYWSSSPYAVNSDRAWPVNFNYGLDSANDKNDYEYVRLVRVGQ